MAEIGNGRFLTDVVEANLGGNETTRSLNLKKRIDVTMEMGELGAVCVTLHNRLIELREFYETLGEDDDKQETIVEGLALEVIYNRLSSIFEKYEDSLKDDLATILTTEEAFGEIEDYLGEQ